MFFILIHKFGFLQHRSIAYDFSAKIQTYVAEKKYCIKQNKEKNIGNIDFIDFSNKDAAKIYGHCLFFSKRPK